MAIIVALTSAYFIAFNKNSSLLYNDKTNQFIHKNPSTIINKLTSKEAGIYYFGFPTCPWCLELLPILDDALVEENETAYVVNTRGKNILMKTIFYCKISIKNTQKMMNYLFLL